MRERPLVLASEWGVSTTVPSPFMSTGSARDEQLQAIAEGRGVTLNVYRIDYSTTPSTVVKHPEHNGKTFANGDESDAYCLAHGLLKVYVRSS